MELRLSNCLYTAPDSVADPDLQIRGRGRGRGGHSDSEIREGAFSGSATATYIFCCCSRKVWHRAVHNWRRNRLHRGENHQTCEAASWNEVCVTDNKFHSSPVSDAELFMSRTSHEPNLIGIKAEPNYLDRLDSDADLNSSRTKFKGEKCSFRWGYH